MSDFHKNSIYCLLSSMGLFFYVLSFFLYIVYNFQVITLIIAIGCDTCMLVAWSVHRKLFYWCKCDWTLEIYQRHRHSPLLQINILLFTCDQTLEGADIWVMIRCCCLWSVAMFNILAMAGFTPICWYDHPCRQVYDNFRSAPITTKQLQHPQAPIQQRLSIASSFFFLLCVFVVLVFDDCYVWQLLSHRPV